MDVIFVLEQITLIWFGSYKFWLCLALRILPKECKNMHLDTLKTKLTHIQVYYVNYYMFPVQIIVSGLTLIFFFKYLLH